MTVCEPTRFECETTRFETTRFEIANDVAKNGQMLADVVPLLRCPFCSADSQLALHATVHELEFVKVGTLTCESCGTTTPIRNGIWHAMGTNRAPRTLAQLSNVLPPVPQLYEAVWRIRSLTFLSGRKFPISEEIDELRAGVGTPPVNDFRELHLAVDVACSEGLYARSLADTGYTVLAIDHSTLFLRQVTKRRQHRRVVPIRAVAQSLPIANAVASAVVLGGSLNEIGDRQTALNELGRVCATNGSFFSMSLVANGGILRRLRQRMLAVGGVSFPTLLHTRAAFERAGFEIATVKVDQIVARLSGKLRPASSHRN